MRDAAAARPPSLYLAETLFDRSETSVTDELRSYARSAYRNLLTNLAERLLFEREGGPAGGSAAEAVSEAMDEGRRVSQDLASALLHRAEEARMSLRIRQVADAAIMFGNGEGATDLSSIWAGEDAQLRHRLATYEKLRSLRGNNDRGPGLLLDELPPEIAREVVWSLAARLSEPGDLDSLRASEKAASLILSETDLVRSPQHAAMMLAARMQERSQLDDWVILKTLFSGDVLLASASVAVRARISSSTAWLILVREPRRAAGALLKAVGIAERPALQMLNLLLRGSGEAKDDAEANDLAREIYDRLSFEEGEQLLAYWQLDPHLRRALRNR